MNYSNSFPEVTPALLRAAFEEGLDYALNEPLAKEGVAIGVQRITLPDGREAEVQLTITCEPEKFCL